MNALTLSVKNPANCCLSGENMKHKFLPTYFKKIATLAIITALASCASPRITKVSDFSTSEQPAFVIPSEKELNDRIIKYKHIVKFQTLKEVKNKKSKQRKNAIIIAWENKSSLAEVEGYKLYFGSAPNQYDGKCLKKVESPIFIPVSALKEPTSPVVTIKKLDSDKCYFAVSSYNKKGESPMSSPIEKITKSNRTIHR